MKKTFIIIAILCFAVVAFSQEGGKKEAYEFNDLHTVPATPVKNQYRSGTCWTFASASFIESELLRMGKGEYDISEMFFVRCGYHDHAQEYVRFHGKINFSSGAEGWDVMNVVRNYGLVPVNIYPGLEYGEEKHVHGEMDEVLNDYVDGVIESKNKKLSTVWLKGFDGILDAYLGEYPSSFEVDEKAFTPESFRDQLGFNPDNFVALTSFTNHPYFSKYTFESPDNWSYGTVYNIPFDELIGVIEQALKNDYSVAWAADVSEKGFQYKKGIAVVPEEKIENLDGLEQAKWDEMSDREKQQAIYSFEHYIPEMEITPEIRQEAFDNYETTDDHLMQIIGYAVDMNKNFYFKVKNSWGTEGSRFDGYFYASKAYVRYKTMTIMLHKDILKKEVKEKLGIE